jgi:hypothetical protein
MANLTLVPGENILGNYGDTDIDLNGSTTNIISVKTFNGTEWLSWISSEPISFQKPGSNIIPKGKGFIANCKNPATIAISDTLVNVNDININPGLDFLALPFDNKAIINGFLPRLKINSTKTILWSVVDQKNTWQSWTLGLPDNFQKFFGINKNVGYIYNISKIYSSYLDNNLRENANGVRIGTNYSNAANNNSTGVLVEFTPDSIFTSIEYTPQTVNPVTPKNDLWISLNGNTKLLKYPVELAGSRFSIKEATLEVVNYGLITDTNVTADDNGLITDTTTLVEDYGDLVGGYNMSTRVFTGIFTPNANNSSTNPLVISDIISIEAMELMYDMKTISATPTYNRMYISVGGTKTVLEFASEYTNDNFVLIKNGVAYQSTFVVSSTFKTL